MTYEFVVLEFDLKLHMTMITASSKLILKKASSSVTLHVRSFLTKKPQIKHLKKIEKTMLKLS